MSDPLDMSLLDGGDDFKPRPPSDTRKTDVPAAEGWPRREPVRTPETAQLGLRTKFEDVEKFKRLAHEGNWTQPQLLRRMMRAYEMHPDKAELGR